MIEEIIKNEKTAELRSLFAFDNSNSNEEVIFKFNIWARFYFNKYFTSKDYKAHEEMDLYNLMIWRNQTKEFVNAGYRGLAKTTRTKLFLAFAIANDLDRNKRYIRVLSNDFANATQIVTDIYNMFIQPKVKRDYPEIFEKTENKREETKHSFTTATGIKVLARQVNVDQRGKIMEDAKSDLDWFDDFETKKTLQSQVITKSIWNAMEEARTGLAITGGTIYTCNYISENGNVDRLMKKSVDRVILSSPIADEKDCEYYWNRYERKGEKPPIVELGMLDEKPLKIYWERYNKRDILTMMVKDDDFWGERMNKPTANKNVYFDRKQIEKMEILNPIKEVSGFKIFKEYNPLHRYAGGMDIAGGLGLDSSTSVFIDFDTIPAQVVATYHNNQISPEAFGNEMYNQSLHFGNCLIAPENNKYDQAILKAKQLGAKLYMQQRNVIRVIQTTPTTYGWNTGPSSKDNMFSSLREAIENGHLALNDEDLINEAKSYSINDILENTGDVRLVTKHWDLITACAIAWKMKSEARPKKDENFYIPPAKEENNAI